MALEVSSFISLSVCTWYRISCFVPRCQPQVRRQVTFHVFFPANDSHDVALKTASEGVRILDVNCSLKPKEEDFVKTFATNSQQLPYPVNTARNVARAGANTKFVLVSELDLLPSANLSRQFLDFVKGPHASRLFQASNSSKIAFALPAFEVDPGLVVPLNKSQLVELLEKEKARIYIPKSCGKFCHLSFPGAYCFVCLLFWPVLRKK